MYVVALAASTVLVMFTLAQAPSSTDARARATAIVKQIQHADYAGDRSALMQLHQALSQFTDEAAIRSRVLYWRGFALWRRSINGFNEAAAPAELERDLLQAIDDFRGASASDPRMADAKVGEASCLVNLSFLRMSDAVRAREWFTQSAAALESARIADPANPRLLWVQGANQWYARPEQGGGQTVAFATYQRGLALAREQKGRARDALEPQWGEAELLMNLAFAHLNAATPDPSASERYAREALALVPHWHYVRDILLPQILKAKGR